MMVVVVVVMVVMVIYMLPDIQHFFRVVMYFSDVFIHIYDDISIHVPL